MSHGPDLFPANHSPICPKGHECPSAVTAHEGRFYITFGHAAFNSAANNGAGYATEAHARAAIRRHTRRRPTSEN